MLLFYFSNLYFSYIEFLHFTPSPRVQHQFRWGAFPGPRFVKFSNSTIFPESTVYVWWLQKMWLCGWTRQPPLRAWIRLTHVITLIVCMSAIKVFATKHVSGAKIPWDNVNLMTWGPNNDEIKPWKAMRSLFPSVLNQILLNCWNIYFQNVLDPTCDENLLYFEFFRNMASLWKVTRSLFP